MIVHGSESIDHVASLIRQKLLPKISDAYMATDVKMLAMLLDLISEDYDRNVDVLLRDQQQLQLLLRQTLTWLNDPLAASVRDFLEEAPLEDMRVRTLSRRADRGMMLFIRAHANIEQASYDKRLGSEELNRLFWHFIGDYAERRRYHSDI